MKMRRQSGFTLVEVVVSFAVLAIISGTLMQIFVTSGIVNQKTYETDKANALSTQILERFKATPEDAQIEVYPELIGANKSSDLAGIHYYQYLDRNWQPTTFDDRIYIIEIVTTNPVPKDNGEMSFYQEPVYSSNFTPVSGGTYTIEVLNPLGNTQELYFQITGGTNPTAINYANIKDGVVSALFTATTPFTGPNPININIQNKAKIKLDGNGKYDITGTEEDFEFAVFISGVPENLANLDFTSGSFMGYSSYGFVSVDTVDTYLKKMEIKVIRVKDNAILIETEASKYVVDSN